MLELRLWLLTGVTAILPFIALTGAIRQARQRALAHRLGIDAPVLRVRSADLQPPSLLRKTLAGVFACLAAISLVLMLACIAAWIYSHRVGGWDRRYGPYPEDSWQWSLNGGTFAHSRNKVRGSPLVNRGEEVYREMHILHLTCGLSTYSGPNFYSWNLRTPLWVPTMLFALLPTLWLLRRPSARRRTRLAMGLCPICAHDMRSTPERCPECGVTIYLVQ